jgi:diguanylate cyclase (GGDEF)-like protein
VLRDPVLRFAYSVIAAGVAALTVAIATGALSGIELTLSVAALAALFLVSEAIPLRLPLQGHDMRITASNVFAITILAEHGLGTMLLVVLGVSIADDLRLRLAPVKLGFNVANYVIAAYAAHLALEVGLLAGALTFVAVNTVLTNGVCSLATGVPLRTMLFKDARVPHLIDQVLVLFVPVVALVAEHEPVLLPLFVLPLISVLYGGKVADHRRRDALHDPLTDLPNRLLFGRQIGQELSRLGTAGGTCAVLIVDLDRFRDVNDTLGHAKGDLVLREVARTLSAGVRPGDIVARLSGAEFGVLAGDETTAADALVLAHQLRAALAEPFDIGGLRFSPGARIGVALSAVDGDSADAILRRADVAVSIAEERGSAVAMYDAGSDPNTPERLALATELREGIARGELVLHYQPKVSATDGRVDGVEALVRWQHPTRGLIFPGDFLELAERNDLMRPLTMNVLEQALRQVAEWRDQGIDLHVAVNLSAETLLDLRLGSEVAGLLQRFAIPACNLQLELTESSLMRDPQRSEEVLEELSASGVRIAIDDFGTGWSSLVWLKRLPVQVLKIDRSFIGDMLDRPSDAAIVESTINLGRTLGLVVVAEGVETEEALERLRDYGCDVVQGYLIRRPQPAEELLPWLRERVAPRLAAA